MLFLAVTLGFFVENQREHYIEHKRGKEYARLLKLDLIKDTSELSRYINVRDAELQKMAALSKLRVKEDDKITLGDLRILDSSDFMISPFQTHNATLSQLKSSGSLRYFESVELKDRLANYEWTINKLHDMYKIFISEGGGLESEHIIQYHINMNKFLTKAAQLPDNMLAGKAGYNFKSWSEYGYITNSLMQVMQMFYSDSYPYLKNDATEIIDLINRKYHLE